MPHTMPASEAARVLGVHLSTLHRIADRGELDCTKGPGPRDARYFDPAQVRRLARKRKRVGA